MSRFEAEEKRAAVSITPSSNASSHTEQRSIPTRANRITRSSKRALLEQNCVASAGSSSTPSAGAETTSKFAQRSPTKPPKRKSNAPHEHRDHEAPLSCIDVESQSSPSTGLSPSKRARLVPDVVVEYHGMERRPRPWRNSPPEAYRHRIERINRSRMFIVGQQVCETDDLLEFYFHVVGSTGNIYTVKIGKLPSCNCPDAKFRGRGECKHIIYVLLKALNARPELRYQISFVPSELREMYEGSLMSIFEEHGIPDQDYEGKRRPLDGACPVCFAGFSPRDKTVWCQTGCGNNVHKACFEQWARTSRSSQGSVRCIYCRIEWPAPGSDPKVEKLRQSGTIGPGGYVNVAEQFGLLPKRGTGFSLYLTHSPHRDSVVVQMDFC
ncbi:hypothetical protein PDE_06101 [Penicillium oxalicum 114-2]|uniref:SWIM-type domain-containing protein n=1 Tax=Penicillium oxalicum (strain 114-2 / CGMCC 5302) TaxID=933388 RepID=S7ZR55_PENO1|nr:hypothetical protein PDE_06101 [Penicillium oxalicum 114-2]